MPGKGNPKITVRATPAVIAEIQAECDATAKARKRGPTTVTEFVLAAIAEKLAHLNRSRKARREKRNVPPDTSAAL